jgi:flagellar biosynthesis/type III secretory pathway chaperone
MSAPAVPAPTGPIDLPGTLRQMIAVLEAERQALASLDADALSEVTRGKEALCEALEPIEPGALNSESRLLAQTAQQLNAVNRRVRNILAANVASRLEAMGAPQAAYQARWSGHGSI